MRIKAKLEPGKVAIVTGGSSGIGKAIARELVRRGMDVWLVAQRADLLDSARKELETGRSNQIQRISIVSADVSEPEQVRKSMKTIVDKSGPPDLLVNSAGVTRPGYVQDLDIEIFDWMMEVNYFGTVYMTKEVLPLMIKRNSGYIVNISSFAGLVPLFGYTAYSGSKGAIRGFSDALHQEIRFQGIGVSVVYPSDTDTPQLEYEQQYKPAETKALTAADGVMTADAVARVVVNSIARGQYLIIPNWEGKLYHFINRVSSPLLYFVMDQIIVNAMKKKNKSVG